jgi:hypothetical protein
VAGDSLGNLSGLTFDGGIEHQKIHGMASFILLRNAFRNSPSFDYGRTGCIDAHQLNRLQLI